MMTTRHLGVVYLFFIAVIGAIFGTVYIQLLPHAIMSDLLELWGKVFEQDRTIFGTTDVLWSYFIYQIHYLALMLVCGLSILGYPVVLLLHFLKAFLLGASIQLFISLWGEHAWSYIVIWVLPSAIFVLIATIFFCVVLGRYCSSFITVIKNKKWDNPLKNLIKPTILALVLLFLAAVVQTYFSPYLFQLIMLQ